MKLKKSAIFIIASLLGTILYSCSDNNDSPDNPTPPKDDDKQEIIHESGNGYEVSYQYNNDVIVLDQNDVSYITRIEADTILYFSSETPAKIRPKEGDILSCKITDITPYGLGNKVLTTQEVGGEYKCVTTTAALDEIFSELKLNAVVDASGVFNEEFTDETGNNFVITSGQNKSKSRSNEDETSFAVDVDPKLEIGFDIKDLNDRHLVLTTTVDMHGNIIFNDKFRGEKEILDLPPKTLPPISIGPVIIVPYFEFGINGVYEVDGELKIQLQKTIEHEAGYRDGKNFNEAKENDSKNSIIKSIELDLNGSAGLELEIKGGLGVYTPKVSVGANVTFGTTFSTNFKLNNPNLFKNAPSLDFDLTVEGGLFAKFAPFAKEDKNKDKNGKKGPLDWDFNIEVPIVEVTLYHYSWPLLPELVDNSVKSTKKSSLPYILDYSYQLDGGLLSSFFNITPGVRVFENEQVYDKLYGKKPTGSGKLDVNIELSGLEDNKSYQACPTLLMFGRTYEHDAITIPNQLVGKWKYTDYDREYYVIEKYDSDGTYRYEEYDLTSNRLEEWGSGTYEYDESTKLLTIHVTEGDDAPFTEKVKCTFEDDKMKHVITDDGKEITRIYYRTE